MSILSKTLLVCPTLNAGDGFSDWISALTHQRSLPGKILVFDSSSDDKTAEYANEAGFEVGLIERSDFNHGATRQQAVDENRDFEFYIFMTQDAILEGQASIENLMAVFNDKSIGAVYGRQLPRRQAGVIERFARLHNYGEKSYVIAESDIQYLGIKAAFLSNSFAAYRRECLESVGGFPGNVIFGEDMYVAAKLLKAGYKVAYAADACVYHSHSYTMRQEFRRYFDMGVFHASQPWIMREFGSAGRAGTGFVFSAIAYLWRHSFWRIPESLFRAGLGYLGFRLGLLERWLPRSVKRMLSMNSGYFGR